MANGIDGTSALQDIDQDNSSGGAKVFNIDDYKKNKNPVEQKVVEVSEKITKNLNGDDNLKNELESKIKSIIGEEEVKTSGEEIKDLIEVISKNLIVEDKQGTEIEVKKIKIELDRWKEENMGEVNEFKKEVFEKKLLEETKKLNPDLKAEESNNIRAYGKLVSEIYFSESIIDGQKDEALQANNQLYGPGKLENSWTDLRGITNFLAKKPDDVKEIKNRYGSIKSVLKNVNLPGNIKETRSFDNVISGFNDQGVSNLFSKTQGYLGWYERVDKLTGGWLNKTISGTGQKLVSKIGNQAVGEFAKNSLGIIAEQGFQKGISTVLGGILGGGVKAAATTGTAAAAEAVTAAGAAAVSATGVGAIVVAVAAAAKVLKNAVSKIAEKLGIGIKKGLEENFGKVGGAIIGGGMFVVGLPFLLIGAISAAAVGPILLLVFGGLFGYQMLLGSSVSSLVPPEGMGSFEESLIPTRDPSLPIPEGCPSGWPITNGVITQGPNGGYSHKGIEAVDIANDAVPIYATHPGQAHVTSGPSSTGRWNYSIRIIGVCEGKEFTTGYSHLVSDYLKGTTVVEKGDIIGYVDNSGNSTGPHLHYQVNGLGSINNYLPKAIPNGYRSSQSSLIINVP